MNIIAKRRNSVMLGIVKLVAILFLNECGLAIAAPKADVDSWAQLNKDFKENLHEYRHNKRSIEFCPDNTCDLFVATKSVSVDALGDFIYLYIYFFSDYNYLVEWRNRKEVTLVVKEILGGSKYKKCKLSDGMERAYCIIRYLSRDGRVRLYSVRYDEEVRTVERRNIDVLARQGHGVSADKPTRAGQ